MYELFILGELMTGDKHGYVLQEILKNAAGPIRQISSGTLYPLLTRLMEKGWIHLRMEEESEGGRMRKIYALTEAGRERFLELMETPLENNSETMVIFHFKMVYFQYVPKDIRLACLDQYLQHLRINGKYVVDLEARIKRQQPEPEKQRVQLLRMLEHRRYLGEADIAWVMSELERVQASES